MTKWFDDVLADLDVIRRLAAGIGATGTIHHALAWLEWRGHLIGIVDQCSTRGSTKLFDIPAKAEVRS